MRSWLFALGVFAALPALSQSTEDEAGDVAEVDKDATGPLRERIRPVSGRLFSLRRRFELGLDLGTSWGDAFFTKYSFGLEATYFFTEHIGVQVRGSYVLPLVSGAAQICDFSTTTNVGCTLPTTAQLEAAPAFGQIKGVAGVNLQWAPIYGKLGLFAGGFPHFSMYGALGPAAIFYGPASKATIGGDVAIGFRIVATRWMAVRTEIRDLIYFEDFRRSDADSADRSSVRNQLFFHLGLSFFFPTAFEEDRP